MDCDHGHVVAPEEPQKDYSKWSNVNFIPLIILGGFLAAVIAILT